MSPGPITWRASELCGAPDRQPAAMIGPWQGVSLPRRVIVSRIDRANVGVANADPQRARPASIAASVIAAACRM